jgi:hypothetical protein
MQGVGLVGCMSTRPSIALSCISIAASGVGFALTTCDARSGCFCIRPGSGVEPERSRGGCEFHTARRRIAIRREAPTERSADVIDFSVAARRPVVAVRPLRSPHFQSAQQSSAYRLRALALSLHRLSCSCAYVRGIEEVKQDLLACDVLRTPGFRTQAARRIEADKRSAVALIARKIVVIGFSEPNPAKTTFRRLDA